MQKTWFVMEICIQCHEAHSALRSGLARPAMTTEHEPIKLTFQRSENVAIVLTSWATEAQYLFSTYHICLKRPVYIRVERERRWGRDYASWTYLDVP